MSERSELEERILRCIRGYNRKQPQTLSGIIAAIDASERMILTREELSTALRRLLEQQAIAEIEPRKFCTWTPLCEARSYVELSEVEYEEAVQAYRIAFQQTLEDDTEDPGYDFTCRKVVLYVATPGGRWPELADEDRAESLAEKIDPIIEESGLGEVNGFEMESKQIGVLIFGRPTDEDLDAIYELVAPVFRAEACPPGSHILRVYNDRGSEITSDHVR